LDINPKEKLAMREQLQNIPRSLKLPSLRKNEQNWIEGQNQGTLQKVIRPITDDRAAWDAYWQAQSQPWRIEPEISPERQVELEKCRAVVPYIEKDIYPFKGMKLDRADLEWLLSTIDSEPGSETWSDEKAKEHAGLDVRGADLHHADLHGLPLTQLRGGLKIDDWYKENKEQGSMAVVLMGGTNLIEAQLKGADLAGAHLEGAYLNGAHLEGANLAGADLEGANLNGAHLEKANLRNIWLANQRDVGPQLADVQWGNTNLAVVDWSCVSMLGDEFEAKQENTREGKKKDPSERLLEYQEAVRANRQLAVALQAQGLHEEAARFAYRAQRLQRTVLRRQQKFGSYLFSGFLDLIAGYGYRPERSLIAYLVMIFGFMGLSLLNAHFVAPHLRWDEALVLSVSSFHGRGFFSQDIRLGDTYARLASAEAMVGLLIEISLIATFTQRYFGK
jgi:uncharacterized protein YjbI with pentapeptide repeats